MKRSGFKPKAPRRAAPIDREQRLQERAERATARPAIPPRAAVVVNCAEPVAPVRKEEVLRSEPYRRLVASMPCAHCRTEHISQHAHENQGKGAAMKVDDRRSMPLCCDQPGREGCHTRYDQGRLLPGGREAHRASGARWAAETRADIIQRGLWPANLPRFQETP